MNQEESTGPRNEQLPNELPADVEETHEDVPHEGPGGTTPCEKTSL